MYDPKDVIIVLSGLILGVKPVIIITFATSSLEMLSSNGGSTLVGFVMNFFSSLAFCLPAIFIYNKFKIDNRIELEDNVEDNVGEAIYKDRYKNKYNDKSESRDEPKKEKPERTEILLLGLILSSITQVIVMILFNLLITPKHMNVPVEYVKSMMFNLIIPFNLIKALVNSAIIFVLYKPAKNF